MLRERWARTHVLRSALRSKSKKKTKIREASRTIWPERNGIRYKMCVRVSVAGAREIKECAHQGVSPVNSNRKRTQILSHGIFRLSQTIIMTRASFHGHCFSNSNNAWNLGDANRIPAFFRRHGNARVPSISFSFFSSVHLRITYSEVCLAFTSECFHLKRVELKECEIVQLQMQHSPRQLGMLFNGRIFVTTPLPHPPKQSYQRQRRMYPICIQMKMYVRNFRHCARFDTVFDVVRWLPWPHARGEHRFLWMIWMMWSLHRSAFGFRINALGVVAVHRILDPFRHFMACAPSEWKNQMKH